MENQQQQPGISAPALPKGGGAIQSIGKGWSAVGTTGSASFDISLPISPGRGYAPGLALSYQSTVGNGLFGLGWSLNLGCVARRASKGVPTYTDDDVMIGPSGDVWLPELNADETLKFETVSNYNGLELDQTYQVIRYFARIEDAFDRIEHWRLNPGDPGFWLIHGADASLALYGKNPGSRTADPTDSNHVAQWLLEETMNEIGEHILYEYKPEDEVGLSGDPNRDYIAQRYLWRVRYGNAVQYPHLYLWTPDSLNDLQWHFDLLFDYGERDTDKEKVPTYEATTLWPVRNDPHSSFAYGFELGNLRLCHQVLMFHHFPDELGAEPRLINRLLLQYKTLALGYQTLSEVHHQALSAPFSNNEGALESRPPLIVEFAEFNVGEGRFSEFDAMPGLNSGAPYQLVDLYGEGISGVLYREDKNWLYREPLRAVDADSVDAVTYGPWRALPEIPVADAHASVRQTLTDLTGDGRLDWLVAQPGMAGVFTLNPDRTWSKFATFNAFPLEFFHPLGQLADLVGDGLSDLALIGPRSVRLYANRRAAGFAPGLDVDHSDANDRLPLLSDSPNELVAFSDVLGTGQQHLIRIRHNEIRCWPNLGHGRFGTGKLFAKLPFTYEAFDSASVRLADLDGSGATDLLYLEADRLRIFMNRGGNGLNEPFDQVWPDGVRYDRFCEVSVADLQGLGCSSVVLTVPHMQPRHWRFDYPAVKPYLLTLTNNYMGAISTVEYRSSAQEWLDEKRALLDNHAQPICELPFALHLVVRQTQLDQITGNRLSQHFQYRHGYYDGHEREFRGFGLLIQSDTELPTESEDEGFTAPVITKTWFHTGRFPESTPSDCNDSDPDARPLGAHLLTRYDAASLTDSIITDADQATLREMARTLAGSVLRTEVFGLDGDEAQSVPYSVQTSRYLVRQLEAVGPSRPYARMLPRALESINYHYERQADDPLCAHSLSLAWDAFGALTHGVTVNYARRKKAGDAPPFEDEYQQTWWQASHDDAQQCFYLQEARAEFIHLDAAQSWRLGLPYRQRSNAMVVPATALAPEDIGYEKFIDPKGKLAALPRTLTGLSVQRYLSCGDGEATFIALADATETAELDDHALTAYDRVMTPEELTTKLLEVGYERMPSFLPDDDLNLWSIKRGFNTYAGAEDFYSIATFRPTRSHGWSSVEYDAYHLAVTRLTDPAGCATSATYDYRTLQPRRIVDPNQNTQEAAYDAFGMLRATSFYGTELGEDVGFDPIDEALLNSISPRSAVHKPDETLGNLASVHCYDAFSWMNGEEPAYGVTLLADRYPGDPEKQTRVSLASFDGFGRTLQTRQWVEAGQAFQVNNDGSLSIIDGKPVVVEASPRWRVSEQVEYNNKGLAVRVYRPYFSNNSCYVNDASYRQWGFFDKQFYDPLGRPTITVTANEWMRRQTYLTWYTISEDENDTAEEVLALRAASQK
ncbi:MAG TPA: SpvB/TcaC N-terminal domain-containing protein [Pseudomonas sp.]|uniref:SpvB/TcaC N-terminal domain-containing protein n=1 Tax=Pseudomonas sp. TaxID=306 RepID=UPI002ED85921